MDESFDQYPFLPRPMLAAASEAAAAEVVAAAETDGELRHRLPKPVAAGIRAGLRAALAQVKAELEEESCCNLSAGQRQQLAQAHAWKKN
jgi:ABC-type phosphate transport system ATPase subunit